MFMRPKKKLRGFPHVFRNPLFPIPNLRPFPSSLGAREPISVTSPFDLLGKKGTMMQKVSIGQG
jgi:hypothetical protein